MKKNKHPLITGTLLLTAAGLASRIIGFFYKIFLVSLIGAEGIGIYQMVFPTYMVCVSLASSGIQTAVSRFTAENFSTGQPRKAQRLFLTGLSEEGCQGASLCVSKYVWQKINESITRTVDEIKLDTLVNESREAQEKYEAERPDMNNICR